MRISYYLWLGLITAEIWNPPREGIGVHSQRTPSLPLFGFTVMENLFSSSHSSQTWLPTFCNSYSLRDHLVWICRLLWLIFCIFHLKTKDLFHFCEVSPCCKSEKSAFTEPVSYHHLMESELLSQHAVSSLRNLKAGQKCESVCTAHQKYDKWKHWTFGQSVSHQLHEVVDLCISWPLVSQLEMVEFWKSIQAGGGTDQNLAPQQDPSARSFGLFNHLVGRTI